MVASWEGDQREEGSSSRERPEERELSRLRYWVDREEEGA